MENAILVLFIALNLTIIYTKIKQNTSRLQLDAFQNFFITCYKTRIFIVDYSICLLGRFARFLFLHVGLVSVTLT